MSYYYIGKTAIEIGVEGWVQVLLGLDAPFIEKIQMVWFIFYTNIKKNIQHNPSQYLMIASCLLLNLSGTFFP